MCHFHSILLFTRWLLVFCVIGGLSFPAGAETFNVTNTNDTGAGSLRQAIIDANVTTDVDTINFSLAANSTITLLSGQIEITKPLTIDGSGAPGLRVSGDDVSRVFQITGAIVVSINSLTIQDGDDSYGAGIYNAGGTLNVTNCTISNNNASIGGGIKNTGTLTVINSTFSGNNAASIGGGILNYGSSAKLTVKNSTFSENHANDQGGGIYNDGDLEIANSIVSANSVNSGGYGPEIFNGTVNGGGDFSPSGNNVFGFDNGVGITTNTDIFTGDCHCVTPTTDSIADIIGDLTNNGGPTQTRAPVIGGLAHNAGVNSAVPTDLDYDQRGLSRIVADVDIGAVEINVMPLNDTGIQFCGAYPSGNNNPCLGTEPDGQDAHYGRDADAGLIKIGGGAAGFDYTKIANDGSNLAASAMLGIASSDWACTRDNVSGLIWEVKTDSGLRDQNSTYTWYDSTSTDGNLGTANGGVCNSAGHCDTEKFVADVNAGAGLCGYHDWRMPTIKELYGITHLGRLNPSIDPTYFPNTPSSWFWSGSPHASYSSFAWVVNFNDGNAYGNIRDDNIHVRLVRGGQSFDSFVDNRDGTITQINTGLMWKTCSEGQTWSGTSCNGTATFFNWSTALLTPATFPGYTDWRLPNTKELQALTNYNLSNPAVNASYFPTTPSWWFWSGSPFASLAGLAWVVDFHYGSASKDNRYSNGHVRLVRGGLSFNTYALTVKKTGSGTVTSNGNLINCGAICSYPFFKTTRVTLTATPDVGYQFAGWSDSSCSVMSTCTVTLDAAKNITANFTITQRTLSISKVGHGRVFTDGNEINCGATCSSNFDYGTIVTLKTSLDAGYVFTSWSSPCTGTGNCEITMNDNKEVTATFTQAYSITTTVNPTDGGTVTCTPNPVASGGSATCTATANPGYTFANFSGDCVGLTCALSNIIANQNVSANFTAITYSITATANPTAGGTVNCTAYSVAYNDSSTCTATANSGYTFNGFSGDCTGSNCALSNITADKTVTANFNLTPIVMRRLSISTVGSGTVTNTPTLASINVTNFGPFYSSSHDVAVQADGKILVIGQQAAQSFALARYTADGYLDTTFGSDGNGRVTTDFGDDDKAYSLTLQSDNKILVAGKSGSNVALARYCADGILDSTFDGDGKITIDLGGIPDRVDQTVLVDANRILVAGKSGLARYTSTGVLDTSFGTDGKVTTVFSGSSNEITSIAFALDSSGNATGKILVAGTVFSTDYDIGLARYNTDGSLDTSFGGGTGKVTTDFGSNQPERGNAIAVQSDGKILIAGSANNYSDFALARYNTDGSLDTTFDSDGKVITDLGANEYAHSLVIQSEILVAGLGTGGGVLLRYNANGSLDTSFGSGGKITGQLGLGYDEDYSVALTAAGTILLAAQDRDTVEREFALARYTSTGQIETTFGGISCGATCMAEFADGASVTLNANPATGSTFTSWGDACSGSSTDTCTVTMNDAKNVTANFTLNNYSITATANPTAGGSITCTPNPVTFGNTASCIATANPGYSFNGFSGDCSGTTCALTNITTNKVVTANFTLNNYSITATANPTAGGSVICSPSAVNYNGAANCTAAPNAGYTFANFSGDCSGTTCALTNITTNKVVTANFTVNTYSITATANPIIGGIVSCNSYLLTYGSSTICTVTANAGYSFNGFNSDSGCSNVSDPICALNSVIANKNIVANFIAIPIALTVTTAGTGGGTITSVPAGINCSNNCTADFASGSDIVLNAIAATGSTFTGWSGGICSGTGACTLHLTAAQTVIATFRHSAATLGLNDTGIDTCGNATANRLPCPVAGFPRQDAEYGNNQFNFTKLDNNGNALPITATNHACVRDNVTGLTWEIKTKDGGNRDNKLLYQWTERQAYVEKVNAAQLCGFNDWRVPDIKELTGIVNYKHVILKPAIVTSYFSDLNKGTLGFWSEATSSDISGKAWFLYFSNGAANYGKHNKKYHLRLVRGAPASNVFVDNKNGTISQSNTGLMWAKCSEGQTGNTCTGTATVMTWEQALVTASNSKLANYSDWRVPNIKELQTLIEYERDGALKLNSGYFPNAPAAAIWSSTPFALYARNAWYLYPNGYLGSLARTTTFHVRLVRSL